MITRTELIEALDHIMSQIMDLIAAIKEASPPKTPPEPGICPVHHVPWQESKYGLAHPPVEKGGRWCNKASLERSLSKR